MYFLQTSNLLPPNKTDTQIIEQLHTNIQSLMTVSYFLVYVQVRFLGDCLHDRVSYCHSFLLFLPCTKKDKSGPDTCRQTEPWTRLVWHGWSYLPSDFTRFMNNGHKMTMCHRPMEMGGGLVVLTYSSLNAPQVMGFGFSLLRVFWKVPTVC